MRCQVFDGESLLAKVQSVRTEAEGERWRRVKTWQVSKTCQVLLAGSGEEASRVSHRSRYGNLIG